MKTVHNFRVETEAHNFRIVYTSRTGWANIESKNKKYEYSKWVNHYICPFPVEECVSILKKIKEAGNKLDNVMKAHYNR